jgi:hypothetical protein
MYKFDDESEKNENKKRNLLTLPISNQNENFKLYVMIGDVMLGFYYFIL